MAFFVLFVIIFDNNMLAAYKGCDQHWVDLKRMSTGSSSGLTLSRMHVGTFAVEDDGTQQHWLAPRGRELWPVETLAPGPNVCRLCWITAPFSQWTRTMPRRVIRHRAACMHTHILRRLKGKIKLSPLNNLQQKIHWKLQDSLSRR